MTPTAYIPVPISENPPQEGYYHTIGSELVSYWHSDKKYQEIYKETKGWDAKITHWLRPVDLSKMLEGFGDFLSSNYNPYATGKWEGDDDEIFTTSQLLETYLKTLEK